MIDWAAFTPGSALAGGVLIGGAAALLVLCGGRIAGISGIVGGLLRLPRGDIGWRIAFVSGLLIAPWLYQLIAALPPITIATDRSSLLLAGLLVGIGTRYAAGCTSGHGVCGLARLSARSLVATLAFMSAGFFTTYFIRHIVSGF